MNKYKDMVSNPENWILARSDKETHEILVDGGYSKFYVGGPTAYCMLLIKKNSEAHEIYKQTGEFSIHEYDTDIDCVINLNELLDMNKYLGLINGGD